MEELERRRAEAAEDAAYKVLQEKAEAAAAAARTSAEAACEAAEEEAYRKAEVKAAATATAKDTVGTAAAATKPKLLGPDSFEVHSEEGIGSEDRPTLKEAPAAPQELDESLVTLPGLQAALNATADSASKVESNLSDGGNEGGLDVGALVDGDADNATFSGSEVFSLSDFGLPSDFGLSEREMIRVSFTFY